MTRTEEIENQIKELNKELETIELIDRVEKNSKYLGKCFMSSEKVDRDRDDSPLDFSYNLIAYLNKENGGITVFNIRKNNKSGGFDYTFSSEVYVHINYISEMGYWQEIPKEEFFKQALLAQQYVLSSITTQYTRFS